MAFPAPTVETVDATAGSEPARVDADAKRPLAGGPHLTLADDGVGADAPQEPPEPPASGRPKLKRIK